VCWHQHWKVTLSQRVFSHLTGCAFPYMVSAPQHQRPLVSHLGLCMSSCWRHGMHPTKWANHCSWERLAQKPAGTNLFTSSYSKKKKNSPIFSHLQLACFSTPFKGSQDSCHPLRRTTHCCPRCLSSLLPSNPSSPSCLRLSLVLSPPGLSLSHLATSLQVFSCPPCGNLSKCHQIKLVWCHVSHTVSLSEISSWIPATPGSVSHCAETCISLRGHPHSCVHVWGLLAVPAKQPHVTARLTLAPQDLNALLLHVFHQQRPLVLAQHSCSSYPVQCHICSAQNPGMPLPYALVCVLSKMTLIAQVKNLSWCCADSLVFSRTDESLI
jgi:hypothetical protein